MDSVNNNIPLNDTIITRRVLLRSKRQRPSQPPPIDDIDTAPKTQPRTNTPLRDRITKKEVTPEYPPEDSAATPDEDESTDEENSDDESTEEDDFIDDTTENSSDEEHDVLSRDVLHRKSTVEKKYMDNLFRDYSRALRSKEGDKNAVKRNENRLKILSEIIDSKDDETQPNIYDTDSAIRDAPKNANFWDYIIKFYSHIRGRPNQRAGKRTQTKKTHDINETINVLELCKEYDNVDSEAVDMDKILKATNIPIYIKTALVKLYRVMISYEPESPKYLAIKRNILFYLRLSVPPGRPEIYVKNIHDKNEIDCVKKEFAKMPSKFPMVSDIPNKWIEGIMLSQTELFSEDFVEGYDKLIKQIHKTKKIQAIEKQIYEQTDEHIREVLLKKFEDLQYINESSTLDQAINIIKLCCKIPVKISEVVINANTLNNMYKLLNEKIYGMMNIKSMLMACATNFAATNKSSIALLGPPGVGKTTILQCVAQAINRPFIKIKMGCITDSITLAGGDKIYIGSGCGRIADSIIKCGYKNPIILLDEIDKIGGQHKDTIYAVLNHLLDPAQKYFDDQFLGIDIDVSNVLFVLTLNDKTILNNFLSDRMLIINVPPLSNSDIFHILKTMKLKELLENNDLTDKVIFDDSAISHLISMAYKGDVQKGSVRPAEELLKLVIKKVGMYISLGDRQHPIIPRELQNFSLPISITAYKLELICQGIPLDNGIFATMYI